ARYSGSRLDKHLETAEEHGNVDCENVSDPTVGTANFYDDYAMLPVKSSSKWIQTIEKAVNVLIGHEMDRLKFY
uniref:Uncharacterized protein n=1 Tax=Amphimedon queenslandica TaxID=400682 RepID=A0A1X7VHS7_AMPQE